MLLWGAARLRSAAELLTQPHASRHGTGVCSGSRVDDIDKFTASLKTFLPFPLQMCGKNRLQVGA